MWRGATYADRVLALCTVALCLVLGWWGLHAVLSGWIPEGDDAVIAIKTHDVFSAHPPLQGMRSTSSFGATGIYAHHPGPAQFYLLAIPYALSHFSPAGLVAGLLLVQLAAVLIAIGTARRTAGPVGGFLVAAVVGLTLLAIGPGLMDPINIFFPVLPMLAAAVLGWRLAAGRLDVLPLFAVVASVVVQAHVSYLAPVAAICLVLVVIGLWQWWIRRGDRSVSHRRQWLWTVVLVAIVWAPVVIELFVYEPNNVGELRKLLFTPDKAHVGAGKAVQQLGSILLPVGPGFLQVLAVLLVLALAAGISVIGILAARRAGSTARLIIPAGVWIMLAATSAIVWVGTKIQNEFQLLYLDLLSPVAWLLVGLCGWWVIRQWVRVRPDPATLTAGGVVVVLAVLLWFPASPLRAQRLGALAAQPVAREATDFVRSEIGARQLQDRPVMVRVSGQSAWTSVGPAIAADLIARGTNVYYDTFWPNPHDDEFRRLANAPAGSVEVWVRDRNTGEPWLAGSMPDGCAAHEIAVPDGRQLQVCIQAWGA